VSLRRLRRLRRPGAPAARLRAALARLPRAAWLCALLACVNATAWSLITPPFQGLDEQDHFAYVQQLAETGSLPSSSGETYSPLEHVALRDLHFEGVRWQVENDAISSRAQQRRLRRDLASKPSPLGSGDAGSAASEPPLYYGLAVVPYELGRGGGVLDQVQLIRLLSAVIAGLTALFAYLFVREALPGAPWAWVVGGLVAALAPLLGSMSSLVNPDALLYAVSAALFYSLARAFRRGLTRRRAVAIGLVTAIGFITKLNFIGLLPAVLLGLGLLTRRAARDSRRDAYRCLALALALAAVPIAIFLLANALGGRSGVGPVSAAIHSTRKHGSLLGEISYIWQLYLPRLPGMSDDFPGVLTTLQVWFRGVVGVYGWLDTPFPGAVYDVALVLFLLVAASFVRGLVQARAVLRARSGELAVYALASLGLLGLVGADSYIAFLANAGLYLQARYLLPLGALGAAAAVLAARGAGRRWGPTLGALIVLLVLAQDIFSQMLVISRFYG
jgi:4-amino-4-deoxy-L-arabinose transferase-like glycosyltransferase